MAAVPNLRNYHFAARDLDLGEEDFLFLSQAAKSFAAMNFEVECRGSTAQEMADHFLNYLKHFLKTPTNNYAVSLYETGQNIRAHAEAGYHHGQHPFSEKFVHMVESVLAILRGHIQSEVARKRKDLLRDYRFKSRQSFY